MKLSDHIIRCSDPANHPTHVVTHPLNPQAKRKTRSLGDATGLTSMGIHLNVVAPGGSTTEHHRHECADEFLYILSGEATIYLNADHFAVSSGDFIGLPARGPAHSMKNTGTVDLVYLVGGGRPDFDVCDYPQIRKRLYLVTRPDGRHKELVDYENIKNI